MEAKRIASRGLWVAGCLFILAAAGAWGKGGCGKTEPEVIPTACTTAADCEGLPHILCVGGWQCVDGSCSFQCNSCDDLCHSDSECGQGMRCSVEECLADPCAMAPEGICHGKCVPDSKPTCIQTGCSGEICASAPAYSYCLWQPWFDCLTLTQCGLFGTEGNCGFALTPKFVDCVGNSGMCQQDADCPAGFECEQMYDCGPRADGLVDCAGGGRCVVAAKPDSCEGDWDCGPYEYCQIQTVCECAYPAGEAPAADPATGAAKPCGPCQSQGICLPKPAGCLSDAECAPGQRCVFDSMPVTCDKYAGADVACAQEWEGYGHCEPFAGQCWSDSDCAPGEMCQIQDTPMPCADAETGEAVKCGALVAPMGFCVPRPVECWSDYDCGPGFVCQFFPDCYGPMAGDAATDKLVACGGTCVPSSTGCQSDWECGPGWKCQIEEVCAPCVYGNGASDSDWAPPCEQVCSKQGVCVPDSTGCQSDVDCGPGYTCQIDTICSGCEKHYPDSAEAPCAALCTTQGTCVPKSPECWSDYDCMPGYVCQFNDYCGGLKDPDSAGAPAYCGGGFCVPKSPECWSDADCPAGTFCQFTDYCVGTAREDGAPADMPCLGGGTCVPKTSGCQSDAECGPGFFCQVSEICALVDPYNCPRDDFNCAQYCQVVGTCVPKATDCWTDADCPDGFHCEITDWCGGADPSGKPAEPVWCGGGTCVKNVVECWSDYDCPAGQACVGTLLCPECMDCFGGGDCMPCPPCEYVVGHCEPQVVCLSHEVCGNGLDDDCDGLVDEDCGKPQCFSDNDCGPYQVCQAVFGAYGDAEKPMACCMPNEICLAIYTPCYAECVMKPGLCFADSDCGQGAHCEGAIQCGCHYGECDCAPDKPGQCVKDSQECVALKSASHGSCKMLLGFIFNGYECVAEGGCSCGNDCPFFFGSLKECQDACKVGVQCWSNEDCPAGQGCAVMKCSNEKCMGPWECVPMPDSAV